MYHFEAPIYVHSSLHISQHMTQSLLLQSSWCSGRQAILRLMGGGTALALAWSLQSLVENICITRYTGNISFSEYIFFIITLQCSTWMLTETKRSGSNRPMFIWRWIQMGKENIAGPSHQSDRLIYIYSHSLVYLKSLPFVIGLTYL